MKGVVALALVFHLGTAGIVVGSDLVNHREERTADLDALRGAATPQPRHIARLPLTIGASSTGDVADGLTTTGDLSMERGEGDARSVPSAKRVEVRAASRAATGDAGVFGLIGSTVTVDKGNEPRAELGIRVEGIGWSGTLTSDGGTAAMELRLRIQDQTGAVLSETVVAKDELSGGTSSQPVTRQLSATEQAATVVVDLEPASYPVELRVTLLATASARGGAGRTSAEWTASYRAVAAAIGEAPPTTLPPPLPPNWIGPITRAELGRHAVEQSCWLLIDGKVYDVSTYLRRHPGSKLPVLKACGKEATQDFLTQGGRGSRHSYKAASLMQEYLIGEIAD